TSEVVARRNYGHLLIELGEVEQARAELQEAGRDAAALGLPALEIGVEALLGVADWRTGDLAAGRRRLARARGRFAGLADARREAETLLDLVELELDAAVAEPDRLGEAQALLAAALAIPATRGDTSRRARSLALGAELAARTDRPDQARALLGELDGALH